MITLSGLTNMVFVWNAFVLGLMQQIQQLQEVRVLFSLVSKICSSRLQSYKIYHQVILSVCNHVIYTLIGL
jgi:hypothetical protein